MFRQHAQVTQEWHLRVVLWSTLGLTTSDDHFRREGERETCTASPWRHCDPPWTTNNCHSWCSVLQLARTGLCSCVIHTGLPWASLPLHTHIPVCIYAAVFTPAGCGEEKSAPWGCVACETTGQNTQQWHSLKSNRTLCECTDFVRNYRTCVGATVYEWWNRVPSIQHLWDWRGVWSGIRLLARSSVPCVVLSCSANMRDCVRLLLVCTSYASCGWKAVTWTDSENVIEMLKLSWKWTQLRWWCSKAAQKTKQKKSPSHWSLWVLDTEEFGVCLASKTEISLSSVLIRL